MEEVRVTFEYSWAMLAAQIATMVSLPLFIAAAWMTWKRGKGTEVPVWIVVSLLVPIIVPIVALVHFRSHDRLRGRG